MSEAKQVNEEKKARKKERERYKREETLDAFNGKNDGRNEDEKMLRGSNICIHWTNYVSVLVSVAIQRKSEDRTS